MTCLRIRIPVLLFLACFSLAGPAETSDESPAPAEAEAKSLPPLPLHGIEGYGGVFSTYSAYLVNAAGEGEILGKPSAGVAYVHLSHDRHLVALTLTETLWDRFEFGFSWNHLNLGDLPDDIEDATGIRIGDGSVDMFNFNARVQAIQEGSFGQSWLPALTFGVHYKYNEDIAGIDDDLLGTLDSIGVEDDDGFDFTIYASKMITALPRPVLLNAGVRFSEAAHLGLFGFTNDWNALFEGNIVVFPLDRLAFAFEYRQKPDGYQGIPDLVEEEDDWWTICAAFVFSEHFTMSGGYGHFGDVLDHEANGSWGIKAKWEF